MINLAIQPDLEGDKENMGPKELQQDYKDYEMFQERG